MPTLTPEETANGLTKPQLRDLSDTLDFTAAHPTWPVFSLRTTTPLVLAGCLTRVDGSYIVTDHGAAVIALTKAVRGAS